MSTPPALASMAGGKILGEVWFQAAGGAQVAIPLAKGCCVVACHA